MAGLLRSALDLFAARGQAAEVKAGEEALQGLRDGVCCTGAGAPATGTAANVTCVRWLREHALVATADRCVSGVASKLEFRGFSHGFGWFGIVLMGFNWLLCSWLWCAGIVQAGYGPAEPWNIAASPRPRCAWTPAGRGSWCHSASMGI